MDVNLTQVCLDLKWEKKKKRFDPKAICLQLLYSIPPSLPACTHYEI